MFPAGFPEKMRRLLGAEYDEFLASYDLPRNSGLRRNPLKGAFPLPFSGEEIPWEPMGIYYGSQERPGLHPFHDAGAYYLQEPSAMAPARLLDVQPGERVLDLCAAPGGKTTQLASAMKGKGLLVCNEIHPKRARILSSNIERLGISNALVLNEHPAKLAERFLMYFDRILVDAPCSGEGMFRKEDSAVTDWSEETVQMCAGRQYEILESAAQMLAPGGRLVYSTCTFSPEENEGVISRFLHAHSDFRAEAVSAPWFAPGRPDWISCPAEGIENTFRLWPHKLRGEGHFAAVLRRDPSGNPKELPLQKEVPAPKELRNFAEGIRLPEDTLLSFGETYYLAPPELPDLRGLRVLRPGLELGEVRKGRFIPAHALSLWLKDFPSVLELPADSPQLLAYLHGETLPCSCKGWTLMKAGPYSIGWAYGANAVLKNHYPKGLRRIY